MNKEYRYQLETRKLTGRRQQKFECPHCGKRKCFVRYVDTQHDNRYVADDVGKCDHEQSCGYHYRPSEYFHDRPWLADRPQPMPKAVPPRVIPVFQPLAPEYVWEQHSPQSTFWQWFSTDVRHKLGLCDQALQRVYEDYQLGATRQSDIIFWQIDQEGRVHTGHIMQYGPDGHRLSYNDWEHSRLMREQRLPRDYVVFQCLFGEHLLAKYPQKPVCIVESEKSALVCAARYPDLLWLATCGSGGLSSERLSPLKGRRITLFPDSGCYGKWSDKMRLTKGIEYAVSERLEAYPPNTDLADVLLGEAQPP